MGKTRSHNTLEDFKAMIGPWRIKIEHLIEQAKKEIGIEKAKSFIGIDIGTSAVKIVQMEPVGGEMSIKKSALVPIGVPGKEEEIIASLQTAMVGIDFKASKVAAVVNCSQTCTRKIVTPLMPKKELAQAIRWEAKNAIPFSIENALMDYEVLGEVVEKGVKKIVVAIAATPRDTANGLISLLSKADIELSALIPISAGLSNLIASSKEAQDSNIAIIEMGALITELNIFQSGRLVFSRKLPIAGNDITKAMTSTLMASEGKVELSFEEAENIKKEHGIPSGEGADKVNGKILKSQIVSLVRPCIEQLASEIERSFDFYREESHGEKVDEIVLYGGSANLKGLTEALRAELDIDIKIGNSFEGVKTATKIKSSEACEGSRFDLAIGAALNKTGMVNLLPIEIREKTKRFFENVSLKAVAVGVVMIILLFTIGLNIQVGAQHKKLDALKLEQRTLIPQLESMRSVLIANQILAGHPYWEDVLREISHTIEPRMHLTELSMENDILRFRGVIMKSDQGAQGILSNFMITLEEGIFRHVSLVTSKKETEDATVSDFEITAKVD